MSRALLRQGCSRTSIPCLVGVVKVTPRSWRGLDGSPRKVRPEQTFDGCAWASWSTAIRWLPAVCPHEFVILLLRPTPQSASWGPQPAFPSGNAEEGAHPPPHFSPLGRVSALLAFCSNLVPPSYDSSLPGCWVFKTQKRKYQKMASSQTT